MARGNLPLPSINQQQEPLTLLHSLVCWFMQPRGMMRTRRGVSAGSSHPLRFLLLLSELVAGVKRKNAGWRRRDVQPVRKS